MFFGADLKGLAYLVWGISYFFVSNLSLGHMTYELKDLIKEVNTQLSQVKVALNRWDTLARHIQSLPPVLKGTLSPEDFFSQQSYGSSSRSLYCASLVFPQPYDQNHTPYLIAHVHSPRLTAYTSPGHPGHIHHVTHQEFVFCLSQEEWHFLNPVFFVSWTSFSAYE